MAASVEFNAQQHTLTCKGEWDLNNLTQLQLVFANQQWPHQGEIAINGEAVTKMDSAGAWLLIEWRKKWEQQGLKSRLEKFPEQYQTLLNLIEKRVTQEGTPPNAQSPPWLARVGKSAVVQFFELKDFFNFIGLLSTELLSILRHPAQFRFSSLVSVIQKTGYQALPIIGLLSLMIGIVLAYQMGVQLRNYGANIFIVNLLGLSVLREFGPLITAIMVAGRTGSAYTAQLGLMKMNQEVDALTTMGITSGELLILPRIIGLVIALPLLTVWADIFGVFGGMLMANNMLHITWDSFLSRFQHEIPLKTLIIGLGKTPIFALLISSIGCFQGIRVEDRAESIGTNTTRSVVLAIFFIIVADAAFSIIFSKLKL